VKKQCPKEKKIINERKGIIPKRASTNETKGAMQGAAQIENLVTKAKNYTIKYMNV